MSRNRIIIDSDGCRKEIIKKKITGSKIRNKLQRYAGRTDGQISEEIYSKVNYVTRMRKQIADRRSEEERKRGKKKKDKEDVNEINDEGKG